VAVLIARLLEAYLVLGALFALPFALFGAGRLDPAAARGTWGFRVLVLPGAMALLPWLLWWWVRGRPPRERGAHLDEGTAR
jgi:hypothetical protein